METVVSTIQRRMLAAFVVGRTSRTVSNCHCHPFKLGHVVPFSVVVKLFRLLFIRHENLRSDSFYCSHLLDVVKRLLYDARNICPVQAFMTYLRISSFVYNQNHE